MPAGGLYSSQIGSIEGRILAGEAALEYLQRLAAETNV
jgi:hypothetical protein